MSPDDPMATLKTLSLVQFVFHRHVRADGSLTAVGIKALLEAEGVTIRSIAARLSVTEGFVHQVISRKRSSAKVEAIIAQEFEEHGLTCSQIWGSQVGAK